MKGAAEALYLLTKNPSGKFEFIFTPLNSMAIPLVDFLTNIHKLSLKKKTNIGFELVSNRE